MVFGGTADRNQWNLTPKQSVRQKIIKENAEVVPALNFCGFNDGKDWAGLRPGRSEVRLEKETLVRDGKEARVSTIKD